MKVFVCRDPESLGEIAARTAAEAIRHSIDVKGMATIVLATGSSQFSTLAHLVAEPGISWDRVTMFHLDEYLGLSENHPASFRKYLRERFISKVPVKTCHLINGEANGQSECERLNRLISGLEVDVALIGIGENGHLAFNDPPADFETELPYIIVHLDDQCRKQQVGEGWFRLLADVPQQAVSMSINQILKSKVIVCSVPDERKADAVRNCLEQEVNNRFPATILRHHPKCFLYLDPYSASKLAHDSDRKAHA